MHLSTAHRHFLWIYVKSLLKLRYRGSYLGIAWNLLQPILYLAVLGFVLSVVNRASFRDYVVYLFAGLIPFRFFEQASMSMLESIPASSCFSRKIRVPYLVFPVVQWGVAVADFLIAFTVLLVILAFLGGGWHAPMAILPLCILTWGMLALGAGILLAVAFVFFQDLRPFVQMGMMLLLFCSTIMFKASLFADRPLQLRLLSWDPVCYWVALFQKPIYYGTLPSCADWLVSLGSAVVLVGAGAIAYRKNHANFYFHF